MSSNATIFDTVRPWLDEQGFTPIRIAALDAACAAFLASAHGSPRPVSEKGIALLHEFEGCARKLPNGDYAAYPDPATGRDPWTIGFGSTGDDIRPGTIWTRTQVEERFAADLKKFAAQVERQLEGTPTTQSQFDAMVSLAYNIGLGNFRESTLLKRHKAGDYQGAAAQFAVWNRANGKVMDGLSRRREAEAKLYRGTA